MAKNKKYYIADRSDSVLVRYLPRVAVVIALIALGIFLFLNTHEKEQTETERGVEKLLELEAISVSDTEKSIRQLRSQSVENEISGNEDISDMIKGYYLDASVVVAGDSLTSLLVDYNVLDDTIAFASSGSGVDHCDSEISEVLMLEPEHVVLDYGLDDIVYFGGDETQFSAAYREVINKLKTNLPETKIYVCEITSVADDAVDAQPEYAKIEAFNTQLKQMCSSLNVTFIELQDLQGDFAADGIHPTYSFYLPMSQRILEVTAPSLKDEVEEAVELFGNSGTDTDTQDSEVEDEEE